MAKRQTFTAEFKTKAATIRSDQELYWALHRVGVMLDYPIEFHLGRNDSGCYWSYRTAARVRDIYDFEIGGAGMGISALQYANDLAATLELLGVARKYSIEFLNQLEFSGRCR